MVIDPAERRARDEALRAVFADAELRHHEVIAEAELDIDYGNSPIVVGTKHDKLASGQRLPGTIEVRLVIRPDGHVGLRSDHNFGDDLTAYEKLLVSGHT
jgi:hypothetical protein